MDRLMDQAPPEVIAEAALRTGCRSVAYTYNDPVIFLEYAVDVAAACRARGVRNVAVSAGYIDGRAREEFFGAMDAANIDLKAFNDAFYKKLCTAELAPVLDTLKYIRRETGVWLEITTLLIPGENDSGAEIEALTQWVVAELGPDVPLHFSAFHPDYRMGDKPRTPPETVIRAAAIARRNGVHHAYTGNISHKQTGSTWCHECGALLIGRDWYEISEWRLTAEGNCAHCGTACAGVFEARPGAWGRKRQPLRLNEFAAARRGQIAQTAQTALPEPRQPVH